MTLNQSLTLMTLKITTTKRVKRGNRSKVVGRKKNKKPATAAQLLACDEAIGSVTLQQHVDIGVTGQAMPVQNIQGQNIQDKMNPDKIYRT